MATGIPIASEFLISVTALRRIQAEVTKIGRLCASGRIQTCDLHSFQAISRSILSDIMEPSQLSLFSDKQIRRY